MNDRIAEFFLRYRVARFLYHLGINPRCRDCGLPWDHITPDWLNCSHGVH